jgi:hypothetical protein
VVVEGIPNVLRELYRNNHPNFQSKTKNRDSKENSKKNNGFYNKNEWIREAACEDSNGS